MLSDTSVTALRNKEKCERPDILNIRAEGLLLKKR